MNFIPFSTDWIICSQCSLVTMLFISMPLPGIGSLELRAQQVASLLAQMQVLLGFPPAFRKNLIDLCSRHRLALHWTVCSQQHPLALLWSDCISLITWIRTWPLLVLSRLDSSHKPFIMLHLCRDSLSARCTVILRCAARQDRVASLTTWGSSHTSRFPHLHGHSLFVGRDPAMVPLQLDTWLLVLPSPSPCAPGVGFSIVHPQLRSTRPRLNVLASVFRLIARRSTHAHLVSQRQSEIHTIDEIRFQLVRSALCSVPRKVEHAPSENGQLLVVRFAPGSLVRCPSHRCQLQTMRPLLPHA